jgi:multiple sugar transport system substrate-binding protein
VGASAPPQTLDEYRQIGARLKKRGRPVGQALSHTFGDAPAWTYPILWAFGGAELDASGGRVVLDSRATLESVKWMTAFWTEACDETGLRWDDSDNNRAFHRGKIGATLNGASIYVVAKRSAAPDRAPIYFAAKRRPEWIRDERGAPMFEDIDHFPIPAGVVPTPGYPAVFSHAVLGYSPNRQAARELLRWLHGREQFGRWLGAAGGYNVGATRIWERDPLWERIDPPLRPFRTAARASRMFGYAGPPNAMAGDVYAKYIVTDMYARAVQGVPPADAVRWAARQLAQSYGR